ncbi:MAG: hypothetical protein SRB1_00151 [Desulfobacteraceae bacterium Eth-SRB1]|nr:MAG: hypothetical protein SRB1_00151 [Desulfobacteraceae bacterium Eth-SRB1]
MKPIFFPFTYISRPVAEALSNLFGKIVVYQPSHQKLPESMEELSQNGMLDIRVPVIKDKNIVDAMLKECMGWINLHQGNKGMIKEFFKAHKDTIPFFNDSLTLQIKADIQKRSRGGRQKIEPDSLLGAILFLHIAREFDMQNWEINQGVLNVEKMEQNLFENLKGENEFAQTAAGTNRLIADDPGDYMTKDRIKAWSLIMQYDHDISGLFITNSRTAFDYLADKTPEAKIIYKFKLIPADKNSIGKTEKWRKSLVGRLEMLAENPWQDSDEIIKESGFIEESNEKVSMTFSLVPGEIPHDFFSRYAGIKPHKDIEITEDIKLKNTLIGLVEI